MNATNPAPKPLPAAEPRALDPDAIYLGDNGRAFCGSPRCAGSTAFHTGRDISGQYVLRVTPELAAAERFWPECEGCGKGVTR
jgi:hypothetical protein